MQAPPAPQIMGAETVEKSYFLDLLSQTSFDAESRIFFGTHRPLPDVPAIMHFRPRLSFAVSGRFVGIAAIGGKVRDFELLPGMAFFGTKPNWILTDWDFAADEVSVLFFNDFFRLLHIRCERRRIWKKHYHSTGALPIGTDQVLGALVNLASDPMPRRQSGLLCAAIMEYVRQALDAEPDRPGDKGIAARTFNRINEYINRNFHQPINRNVVADALGLSPGHISKLFHAYAHETFNARLKRIRMENAAELLKTTPDLHIEQVARFCGFENSNYFSKAFGRFWRCSPTTFRRQANRNEPSPPYVHYRPKDTLA